jgi:hypothetical protein
LRPAEPAAVLPGKIIVPRIVIGGVILDQPAGGELALSAWGPLEGTLGFSKRSIINGPDGKLIHAGLTLRGTTLMLDRKTPRWVSAALRPLALRQRACFSTWKTSTK